MNTRKIFVDHFQSKFQLDSSTLNIIDIITHYSIPIQRVREFIAISDAQFVTRINTIKDNLNLADIDQLNKSVMDEKYAILNSSAPLELTPRVILMDDEPGTPELVSRVFKRHNWDTYCFNKPDKKIINLIQTDKIDLIVSDIRMPNYDGITFTKNIRAADLDQPTIMLITAGSKYSDEEIMTAGANGLVLKPFHNNDLFDSAIKTIAANQTFFRPRELRMKAELNIVLDGVTITKTADISTKGMFVTLDDLKNIRIGNIVSFELTLPGVGVVSGNCFAKWIRVIDQPNQPAGLGTTFKNLTDEDKYLLRAYINPPKHKSIPMY